MYRGAEHIETIQQSLLLLKSNDGSVRQRARSSLVQEGKGALPSLLECLSDNHFRLRWEAAMTLRDIHDPSSAAALVHAFLDEIPGVRWLAAEAIVAIGKEALLPLLTGLQKNFDSIWMREGARHVLHELKQEGLLTPETLRVLVLLSNHSPEETIPGAVRTALSSLKKQPAKKNR